MIEVDRQVREGRGAYPKGWRSRELGLYDNKTIEFSIALSTDKIALDAYKLGYEDGSKQPTAHPALTDNKLADAYGVKRGKIRQSLHTLCGFLMIIRRPRRQKRIPVEIEAQRSPP